jgi:hypothetical protein
VRRSPAAAIPTSHKGLPAACSGGDAAMEGKKVEDGGWG